MEKLVLRDYQNQIVSELKHLPASFLYMSTGTGKTVTSLELVTYNPTSQLLVVCPHSAIQQWKNTITAHYNRYNILEFKKTWTSTKINEFLIENRYVERKAIIINYDMIHRVPFLLDLIDNTWTIIADEIHRIKNYGTKTKPVKATSFMLMVSYKTIYKIGLSATPTQGSYGGYIDYFPQLKFAGYTDLDYYDFYRRHVMYETKSFPTIPFPIRLIVGYKEVNELDDLLKVVARRYKPKYGDFPPQFTTIKIDKCKNYAKTVREKAYIEGGVRILLNNSGRARVAKKTLTTGVILGHDMNGNTYTHEDNTHKLDWIEDFLNDTTEVVSIFYTYNVELASLEKLLQKLNKRYVVINGDTKDKYAEINSKEYEVVIGQFKAMSEALDGLHLRCHIEIFFSMPESSLTYTQAIGRIDRIGQELVPMYYFLVMEKTIDEDIMYNIENKIEFSERTLEMLEI